MARQRNAKKPKPVKPVSLLIVEGETEEIFYARVRDCFLENIKLKIINLKGQGNINKQVLQKIAGYCRNNPKDDVHCYCCIDTEKNKGATLLDLDFIRKTLKERKIKKALSINAIMADPEIESWFFYDVDGILEFLRPNSSKNPKINKSKYNNPHNHNKRSMRDLFERFAKNYQSGGKRVGNLINNLDIEKIVNECPELKVGVDTILKNSKSK